MFCEINMLNYIDDFVFLRVSLGVVYIGLCKFSIFAEYFNPKHINSEKFKFLMKK